MGILLVLGVKAKFLRRKYEVLVALDEISEICQGFFLVSSGAEIRPLS